jgi:hypothetical protein
VLDARRTLVIGMGMMTFLALTLDLIFRLDIRRTV